MEKNVTKYLAAFKFKVVLESHIKDSVAEVSQQYGINPNQLYMWRKQFIDRGHQIFENATDKETKKLIEKIEQLENLIGKKEVEIALLKNYLDFHLPPDSK